MVHLLLILFFATPGVAASSLDCSFLFSQVLKSAAKDLPIKKSLSDLTDSSAAKFDYLNRKTFPHDNKDNRMLAIKDLPLEKVIAAPGHRYLRKPEQVAGLSQYIKASNGGDFRNDKILLNIIADSDGKIKAVDLWNAHHRFLGFMLSGTKTIGQLKPDNIDILVNGVQVWGEQWPHFLPSAGVDLNRYRRYGVVPVGGDIRPGTIALSGSLSNYELGSRNTIGQLFKNTMRTETPKIGVYFGTFDPIHENHVQVARTALEEGKLDQVLVVPNWNSIEKPTATKAESRVKMASLRLQNEKGINLYTGNSGNLINAFGRDPFFERVGQIYGTKQVVQVIGEDSFFKLVEQGGITPQSTRQFLVNPRTNGSEGLVIPVNLQSVVQPLHPSKPSVLSSTEIRRKVKAGEVIRATELDPQVLKFIQEQQLYK